MKYHLINFMQSGLHTDQANDNILVTELAGNLFIFIAGIIGIAYGLLNFYLVMKIDTSEDSDGLLSNHKENVKIMNQTASYIQNGANAFLLEEYIYMSIFLVLFFIVIFLIDEFKFYTAIAFLLGCIASVGSGYLGMYVATRTNVRVTYQAAVIQDEKDSLMGAFNAAFRGGCVMGFFLVSVAMIVLALVIIIFKSIMGDLTYESNTDDNSRTYSRLFEYVAGYGLGGSTVALFCRVGGGIYTKAADVGADLVGKNEFGLGEDSPDNPATIADNVGDNVGDIAGMGSDLFGSFAESTCAALVVSGQSAELVQGGNYLFPLLVTAGGILVCLATSVVATHIMTVTEKPHIERTLRWQLIISSVLLTPLIILLSLYCLPDEINFVNKIKNGDDVKIVIEVSNNWAVMICGLCGLWCGMGIGYITDIFTSTEYSPVQNLAKSCRSGAAINIIQGLALGYLSCIIPMILIASKSI
jgi:H+-translocating diphosphatase